MNKIIEVTPIITPLVGLIKGTVRPRDGFPQELRDAMNETEKRTASLDARKSKQGFDYSDHFVDQLVSSVNQMNAQSTANATVSVRKDEKSDKARLISNYSRNV